MREPRDEYRKAKLQRSVETVVVQQVIEPICYELAPDSVNQFAPDPEDAPVCQRSFEALRTMTVCEEYPEGLVFDSESPLSIRSTFYSHCVKWGREYSFFYHAVTGVGFEFTMSPGLAWYWYGGERTPRMRETNARCVDYGHMITEKFPDEQQPIMRRMIEAFDRATPALLAAESSLNAGYLELRRYNGDG